jgi:serine-type D-Ala-D-Ala carboxypeptidase (penicillin-binding protein 5/6)
MRHLFLPLALSSFIFFVPIYAERQPADPLTGPPFVSAAAWGIFDETTGEQLWGENVDDPRSIASTTKIMTAFVVIRELEQAPNLLDATITFSERAGGTRGSGSRIQAGESVTVRDLLFGLMLPSGNDASVALAEAFGRRFLTSAAYAETAASEDRNALNRAAYDAFIEKMNKTAQELGMLQTTYRNPHGLDAEGHQSTVADLAILTRQSLRQPLFRELVNTRSHVAQIETPDGDSRQARWNNTNQLLGTEGFYGVKTGTTRQAGACLVSVAERGDDRVLMVVLGSASSAVRYVDSRNLYRFAWLERGHRDPGRASSSPAPASR